MFPIFSVEDRIRADHPLRDIKRRVDRILASLSARFAEAYRSTGCPRVPPERLLKALLLMALDSVRSERQLGERIGTDRLDRWFVDRQPSEEAFDATPFTPNRNRLDDHGLTQSFFDAVVAEAIAADWCRAYFRGDGTQIESFASAKSFQPNSPAWSAGSPLSDHPVSPHDGSPTGDDVVPPNDGNGFRPSNPDVDFHGQKRTNDTHRSRTDPEAKLDRKGRGKEANLSHRGHVLNENRTGWIRNIIVTQARGPAERSAALDLLDEVKKPHGKKPKTVGADKGSDEGEFYRSVESREIEPHLPRVQDPRDPKNGPQKKRLPGVEACQRMKARMASAGDRLSQKCRKKGEECVGWLKSIGGLGRSRTVGRWKWQQAVEIGAAAFNRVRLLKRKPA